MANPEHLAILKQGVEQWTRWSGKSGGCPDARRANLVYAEPCQVALTDAPAVRVGDARSRYLGRSAGEQFAFFLRR